MPSGHINILSQSANVVAVITISNGIATVYLLLKEKRFVHVCVIGPSVTEIADSYKTAKKACILIFKVFTVFYQCYTLIYYLKILKNKKMLSRDVIEFQNIIFVILIMIFQYLETKYDNDYFIHL